MRISFDVGVTWLAMSLTPSDVEGICFDNKGNLWVADYSTKKIWKASAPVPDPTHDIQINDNGTWKPVKEVWINNTGVWTKVKEIHTSNGSAWKKS